MTFSSSGAFRTSSMSSAMRCIISSLAPRVVMAAVPRRIPDVWKAEGKVQGLRTRGGFLIEELAWKNGRITSLKIRSTLGGNLRLRLPAGNRLKGIKGMKSAKGKNPNPLFSAFEQPQMQNHSEVKLNKVVLPKANTYDITTRKGETIRLF